MKRSIECIIDGKRRRLEIDYTALRINQGGFLHFIKSRNLLQSLDEHAQFILFGHDNYIQHAISKAGFGSYLKIVSKLVAVGHRNKEGICDECPALGADAESVRFGSEKILHRLLDIGSEPTVRVIRKIVGNLCVEARPQSIHANFPLMVKASVHCRSPVKTILSAFSVDLGIPA